MARTAAQQAAIDRVTKKHAQDAAIARVRQPKTGMQKVNETILEIPGMRAVNEFASGVNRSIFGMADFVIDPVNELLGLAGIESRLPRVTETAAQSGVATRDPQSGMTGDIAAAVGEVAPMALGFGQTVRSGAALLPELAAQSESALPGVLRSAAQTTPAVDLGYGAASAATGEIGQQVGGDSGQMIGAFLGGLGTAGGVSLFKRFLSNPAELKALTESLSSMSEEGASRLLANAMVQEGVSPEDVAKQLAALGPDAIPADVNNSFSRLLRTAANQIPRIQGRSNQVLNQRQAGQADRLASGLDSSLGVPGLSLQDEIERLRAVTAPEIDRLYDAARAVPLVLDDSVRERLRSQQLYGHANAQPPALSQELRELLTGNNSVGKAFKIANSRMADKRALGEDVGIFHLIDSTKQQIDDEIGAAIRAGTMNRARDLVRMKNLLVGEADAAVPGYKAARNAFAGRAGLESAADQGTLFLKMTPREIEDLVSGLGESELRMFRLGAKQAILDKIDSLPVGADSSRRLFGRNGDVGKLQSLFPDEKSFDEFSKTLEREANFSMTRRAAQGNSTTAMQLQDMRGSERAMNTMRAVAGDPAAAAQEASRIFTGLATKKGERAYQAALERAGDILLDAGTDPVMLQRLLMRGDSPRLRELLRDALPISQSIRGVQSGIVNEVAP